MIVVTAYRQENGLLSMTLGSGFYRVDGQIYEIKGHKEEVIIEEASVILGVTKIDVTKTVNSYLDVVNDQKVSVEDYERTKRNLLACRIFDDDDLVFPDTESELKFNVFMKTHAPVFTETQTETPVAVNITGSYLKSHPFIIAKRKLGEGLENTLYQFNVVAFLKAKFIEKFEQNGYKPLGYTPVSFGPIKEEGYFHSFDSLRWAKIFSPEKRDGNYLTTIFPGLRETMEREKFVLVGSFEELEEKLKFYEEEVDRQCALYFNAKKPITSVKTIGAVYDDLNAIISLINELDVMKKSTTTYQVLRKKSSELRASLEQACKDLK